jgi:FMN hydrolase / 5-amino-6-(5-phospho-D-ribitylamino)uracil phosphatase
VSFKALSIDLDDTLWPIAPTIARAEAVLHDWLRAHAPATAARFGVAGIVALRDAVAAEFPAQAHDFTWMRRVAIERALQAAGDDPALTEPAFQVFFAARQRVELFPDALPALQRLAAKFPILGLTNGNADWQGIGLAPYLGPGCLSAREFGVGKPHPSIFQEACRRLQVPPAELLHIGDDWALDVVGAQGAGAAAAWVRRDHHPDKPAGGQAWFEGTDLLQLADALGA